MEKASIHIRGVSALLQHRYAIEDQDETGAKRKDAKFDSKTDAEKALYRNEQGCFVPSTWIEAAIREAAKDFKGKGKASLKTTVLASVLVEPEEIPLGKDTYDEIDRRPVVVQRQHIVRSRPRFNSWELKFVVLFDGERISRHVLHQIVEEAGKSKGIGDYRPKFGRFEVVSFD